MKAYDYIITNPYQDWPTNPPLDRIIHSHTHYVKLTQELNLTSPYRISFTTVNQRQCNTDQPQMTFWEIPCVTTICNLFSCLESLLIQATVRMVAKIVFRFSEIWISKTNIWNCYRISKWLLNFEMAAKFWNNKLLLRSSKKMIFFSYKDYVKVISFTTIIFWLFFYNV